MCNLAFAKKQNNATMKQNILKALNIEHKEFGVVALLIAQSMFMGFFYGGYNIGGHTLFLDTFKDPKILSYGYMAGGAVGVLITAAYTRLQKSMRFSHLAALSLFVILLFMIAIRVGFEMTDSRWLVFSLFALMYPLNILGTIVFWGMAARLFSLRQGKRLYGIIGTGAVVGIILVSYATPLVPLLTGYELNSVNLFIVCAFGVVVALLFQFIISHRFDLDQGATRSTVQPRSRGIGYGALLKNRYILIMAGFVVLSMIVEYFVQYSFLAATNEQYSSQRDLASFLGIFTGTATILILILKSSVYSKLMKTYGIRVSLLILPFLLGLLTLLTILAGTAFGYSAEASGFVLFFLLVSLSKLFSKSVKDSIETPAFRTLYQSIDLSIRHDVQAKIDGVINRFASLFAGFILFIIGSIKSFELIHFSFFLILIIGVWIWLTFKIYSEYQSSLMRLLAKARKDNFSEKSHSVNISDMLQAELENDSPRRVIQGLNFLQIVNPHEYERALVRNISHFSDKVREYAIDRVRQMDLYQAHKALQKQMQTEKVPQLQKMIKITDSKFEKFFKRKHNARRMSRMIKSVLPEQRILTAHAIGTLKNDEFLPYLMLLLRDVDMQVRRAAIRAAGKLKSPELCTLLTDNLAYQSLWSEIFMSLISIGNPALNSLEQEFSKSDTSNDLLVLIIRAYHSIESPRATELLFGKISHPNRNVVLEASRALIEKNFKANEIQRQQIFKAIEHTVFITGVNISALDCIENFELDDSLKESFWEENNQNHELIYNLLALAYEPQSIAHVRRNIETGAGEGAGFALELLDTFLSESLKPILFPLLDDLPPAEKIRQLQNHFPIEFYTPDKLILDTINLNYNFLNSYTKLVVIDQYLSKKVEQPLVAQMFHPLFAIAETAAVKVFSLAPQTYEKVSRRLPRKTRQHIEYSISLLHQQREHLLSYKIYFLNQVEHFKKLPKRTLSEIINFLEIKELKAEETLFSFKERQDAGLFFIIRGAVSLQAPNGLNIPFFSHQALGNMLFKETDHPEAAFVCRQASIAYQIPRKNLDMLLFKHQELLNVLIELSRERD